MTQVNTQISTQIRKNKEIIFSCIMFIVLLCLFSFMNSRLEHYSPSVVQQANRSTAAVVCGILNLMRIKSTASGATINIRQAGSLRIIYECTGIYIFLIFAAFVLSYPALIRQKLLGLAIFIPALYLVNLFRIVSLAIIQIHWPHYLDPVHKYLWEAVFMVLVVAASYLWLLCISGQLRSRVLDIRLNHNGFHKGGRYLVTTLKFFLYSALGYGLLMIFFRSYLLLLKLLVNAGLSFSWRYWIDYWPMRLVVENKDLWLIYARGKMQIKDAPFLIPNLIPLISLMLVTRLRPKVKALGIMTGSAILCGYHAFTLILVIQKLAHRWLYVYTLFRVYFLFLLPVALWIPFFLYSRKKYRETEKMPVQGSVQSSVGNRKGLLDNSRVRQKKLTNNSRGNQKIKRNNSMGLPGDTLFWRIFYAVVGIIFPLVILLFYNDPGAPGYYLGFFLWLSGLILVLPKSTLLQGASGKKRIVSLLLLYTLFWQGPMTANSFIYVPEGKKILFIDRGGQPSCAVGEGFHLGFYVVQKPLLFELSDRAITITIEAKDRKQARPLIAVNIEVLYRLSKDTDLAKVYTDFGDSTARIDNSLMSELKQQTGIELKKHLPEIMAGSLDSAHIHALLMDRVKKSLSACKIDIRDLKIVNQGNPHLRL